VALIAGLICIRRPGASIVAVAIALSLFLIVEGVVLVVAALSDERRDWMAALRGVVDVAIGIVIIAWPKIGVVTLAALLAATMIVRGAFTLYIAFKLRSLPRETPAAYA
jgi:uncharacterized membrane protein HdeD (DUF308 family)